MPVHFLPLVVLRVPISTERRQVVHKTSVVPEVGAKSLSRARHKAVTPEWIGFRIGAQTGLFESTALNGLVQLLNFQSIFLGNTPHNKARSLC